MFNFKVLLFVITTIETSKCVILLAILLPDILGTILASFKRKLSFE